MGEPLYLDDHPRDAQGDERRERGDKEGIDHDHRDPARHLSSPDGHAFEPAAYRFEDICHDEGEKERQEDGAKEQEDRDDKSATDTEEEEALKIGRASCRERRETAAGAESG